MKNNPILTFENEYGIKKVQTIGDPHLGRTFKTGVPSSKFGVRESLVIEDFKQLLNPTDNIDYVVVMGDLFDKFIVKPSIILTAVSLIETAVTLNPDIFYVIIPGNHDLSKDKTKISSYQLFDKIFKSKNDLIMYKNLQIIYDKPLFLEVHKDLFFYFEAYNPFEQESIDLEVKSLKDNSTLISFGHWDDPTSEFSSYIPNEFILNHSNMIVSGHIHTPSSFKYKDINYVFTGSLQPYSHAEDPTNQYYISIEYTRLEKYFSPPISKIQIEKLKNKNVRIICYPGYIFKHELELLSLTYNNILDVPKEITDDLEVIDVSNSTITDFTTLYLYKLKHEYNIEENILLKINNYLKDNSEDVSFTLD